MAERVTDLTSLVRPDLTVVDAIRILTKGGPTGGSLDYVKQMNTVIASHDIVARGLIRRHPVWQDRTRRADCPRRRQKRPGTMDLSSIKVEEIAA